MPTLEEMTTWSSDEVLQAIQAILPEGWTLSCKTEKSSFLVRILKPVVEGEERVVAWENYHIDQRILLFDAYGWLAVHDEPKVPGGGDLSRRQQLAEQAAARWARVPREAIPPDPEDVDPDEVNAVYEQARKT